jgi:hypothetical protein
MNLQQVSETDPPEATNAGLMWFTQECMSNGAPLESYIVEAERIGDRELAAFFRRALAASHHVRPGDRRRSNRRGRIERRRR